MLKNCVNSNLVSPEIKCTANKNHKIFLYILAVATVFSILRATDQHRNSTHKNMTRISHII